MLARGPNHSAVLLLIPGDQKKKSLVVDYRPVSPGSIPEAFRGRCLFSWPPSDPIPLLQRLVKHSMRPGCADQGPLPLCRYRLHSLVGGVASAVITHGLVNKLYRDGCILAPRGIKWRNHPGVTPLTLPPHATKAGATKGKLAVYVQYGLFQNKAQLP